ncbi:MAG: hypothetical protein AAF663_07235, partial [Planctomycetota bacterium]
MTPPAGRGYVAWLDPELVGAVLPGFSSGADGPPSDDRRPPAPRAQAASPMETRVLPTACHATRVT